MSGVAVRRSTEDARGPRRSLTVRRVKGALGHTATDFAPVSATEVACRAGTALALVCTEPCELKPKGRVEADGRP